MTMRSGPVFIKPLELLSRTLLGIDLKGRYMLFHAFRVVYNFKELDYGHFSISYGHIWTFLPEEPERERGHQRTSCTGLAREKCL